MDEGLQPFRGKPARQSLAKLLDMLFQGGGVVDKPALALEQILKVRGPRLAWRDIRGPYRIHRLPRMPASISALVLRPTTASAAGDEAR